MRHGWQHVSLTHEPQFYVHTSGLSVTPMGNPGERKGGWVLWGYALPQDSSRYGLCTFPTQVEAMEAAQELAEEHAVVTAAFLKSVRRGK